VNYPQIDIRRYDPQLSGDLANLVIGRFDFTGLPHEIRVMRLAALIEMYASVRRIGDLEHTGDWDWRIEIMYAPNADGSGRALYAGTMEAKIDDSLGLPVTDPDPDTPSTMSDTIELRYVVEPSDYLDHFDRWQNLTVEEIDNETGDATYRNVPIDAIRIIKIYYES